ncbi:carboxypeptidase-like regulatory domain-containing protein [Chryseobacterium sp. SSA4.19]|uniref:carboxypeptidase-like regulatory domain-containing protein n=1 Tax=Chryseobacterium sp. SSA4.19 TaxID=2919915 RepID=UPI001F4D4AEC|nr:carboxypeptidase-like regulatory domain-containing protein [Chryseobacterium sp. SSA4.19]MCJ8155608.1 carboxypeptidase-like regulatory domain-containing protein [Chryseobacterium sp. SSA4.19]
MKKTILLFLFLFPLYFSIAQTIKGTVVNDAEQKVSNVNIYIDGTKIGTISKEDGSFLLSLPAGSSGNIVFQKENYETLTKPASEVIGKILKVVLLKSNDIEEVSIIPYTEETYRNYINYFLDQFIGYDREHVRIKNQRTLKFSYDKKNKILKVKAPKTLIIENKNLGYEIEYNLVNFSADFESKIVNCTGSSLFKEVKNNHKIKLNRINAYDGSLLHFFRSIYNNTVAADGFIVNHVIKVPNPKYPTEEELKTLKDFMEMVRITKVITAPEHILDISQRKNNQKPYALAIIKTIIPDSDYVKRNGTEILFTFKDMLQVNYRKYEYEMEGKEVMKSKKMVVLSSFLHPEGETFEVSKDGSITTPDLLLTEGDFTKNKIENMLPLDYQLGD